MDRNAFEARVTALWPGMVRVAACVVRDRGDAEDAAAQAVLRCYQRLAALRREEAFDAWIMRACVNEARSILRRRGRVELRDEWPDEPAAAPPDPPTLGPALMRLPGKDRLALTLMYYENQSLEDIARVLGVPRGTAASRISRARKKLRAVLEEEGLDEYR
ncbi:MAG: sigma-70 family RNA polymerase sigma factor [Eubacteriales bacterium]|nr:sigma-70 family RNA polymerase sigma factor [Eubacteriales bacterium]